MSVKSAICERVVLFYVQKPIRKSHRKYIRKHIRKNKASAGADGGNANRNHKEGIYIDKETAVKYIFRVEKGVG